MNNIWIYPPQRGFREVLEWKTEIISAKSADQTISLRTVPRTELSFKYIFDKFEIETAIEMFRQFNGEKVKVPFWHNSERIGSIDPLDTSFTVDTTMSPYKIGSEVLVIEFDGSKFEQLTISSFTDTIIQTSTTPVINSYISAFIMPLYLMNFLGRFSYQKNSSDYIIGKITFFSDEGYTTQEENNYPSLLNSFFIDEKFINNGSVQELQYRDLTLFDNLAGAIDQHKNKTYSASTTTFDSFLNGRSKLFEFRKWCNFVKGKSTSFYHPRWTKDFNIISNIELLSPYIFLKKGSYRTEYTGHICLILKDGSITVFNVIDVQAFNSTDDRFTLEFDAGIDIDYNDIHICTRVIKSRFNTDRIEINHIHNDLSESSISIIEVI